VLAAGIFILPGWAVLSYSLPGWDFVRWPVKFTWSIGVGLAIYPLLFLWTDVVGLHLGSFMPGCLLSLLFFF
jgi:hypothetical protein